MYHQHAATAHCLYNIFMMWQVKTPSYHQSRAWGFDYRLSSALGGEGTYVPRRRQWWTGISDDALL